VYSPFIDVDYTKLDAATPGMVSIRSLSKVGFPGLRVGYAIGHPATLATLARFISPYAVAGPSIIAAITAVRQHTLWDTIIQRHIATRTWLVKHLTAQGTTCYPSPANWVLVGLGPLARTMAKRLADVGILVQCLDHPTLAGYLRISTPNRQAVGQLVRVLAAVVDMQRGGGRYCLT